MASWIMGIFVFVSVVFGSFSTSECAQSTFQIKSGGAVTFGTHRYESLSGYVKSDEFRRNGMRCGTKTPDLTSAEAPEFALRAPGDCSASLTNPLDEYYPRKVYAIPVVFHIIRKADGTGDIPDSRIYNQVQALNEDYRAIDGSLGGPGFDSHIQFELAGITRTTNDVWFEDGVSESMYKSALGWNSNTYLNIYVNLASGYLGYTYLPQGLGMVGSVWDGIVVMYAACGGRDEGEIPPYNQGRTLTHEAGHYLGLHHTFHPYDGRAGSGGCYDGYNLGDLINETNPENVDHYGCTQTSSCGAPDAIHNYMNYTDDACMHEFTAEQSNRAVCSLLNYRPSLYHIDRGKREKRIFVKRIPMKLQTLTGSTTAAKGVVLVVDEDGQPVPNAIVSVRWSGLADGTDYKKTNSRGRAVFLSSGTDQSGTFSLQVTNVYRAPNRYMPTRNRVSSRSITN